MIEAVSTSSVQSASLRVPPQGSAALPVPATTAQVGSSEFISSRIRVDNELDLAILEFRSSDTGDVVRQYPTEPQIRAFQRAAQAAAEKEAMVAASAKAARDTKLMQQELSAPSSGGGHQLTSVQPVAVSLGTSAAATAPVSASAVSAPSAAPTTDAGTASQSVLA